MNFKGINTSYLVLSLLFIGLYLIGIAFPETWWGVHFFAFIPGVWKWLWLGLGAVILLLGAVKFELNKPFQVPKFGWLPIILLTVVEAALFLLLPIAKDIYGDAIVVSQSLETVYTEVPEQYYEGLFGLSFGPSSGRRTLVPLYIYFSSITGLTLGEIFKWAGVIFGVAFSLTWLSFLKKYLTNDLWNYCLALIGLSSPFMLIYFGHMEFYTIPYFLQLLWFSLLLFYIQEKKRTQLILLCILLAFCIKMHPTGFLMIPALVLALAQVYQDKSAFAKKLTTIRGIAVFVLLPILAAGSILYFFVFAAYNDPRILENSGDLEHVFLPIFSPEVPYDRYNLFSFNHFMDTLNVMLLWSPALLFIGCLIMLNHKKVIKLNGSLLILVFTLVLYLMLLFALNPKVSLPMDWDLYCIPVVILMMIIAVLVKQLPKGTSIAKSSVFIVLGFMILNEPVFWVNSRLDLLSQRYEDLGMRIYKTYYEWAETTLLTSVGMLYSGEIDETYIERKLEITDKMRPHAVAGNDTIFGLILMDNALYYMQMENDFVQARNQLNEAYRYSPDNPKLVLKLLECNFRLEEYETAYRLAKELVLLEYLDKEKAMRIVIHCAIEAEQRPAAIKHCEVFLRDYPQDEFINSVYQDLQNEVELEAIKVRFKAG